jgi:hypothetical protein
VIVGGPLEPEGLEELEEPVEPAAPLEPVEPVEGGDPDDPPEGDEPAEPPELARVLGFAGGTRRRVTCRAGVARPAKARIVSECP